MTTSTTASPELIRTVVARFSIALIVLALMLFVPAGTLRYWEAWLYLAVLFVPLSFAGTYLLKRSPDLIERRMHVREKEPEQKRILLASYPFFLLAFLLPGFDQRFGWSDIPTAVVLAADALVLLGYLTILVVFRENRYASRVVEVDEAQKTITTGPYAVVRHPMYTGTLVMYLASPIALGSLVAFPFMLPIVWTLRARIRNEEQVLLRDLDGYADYVRTVRYRLVPRVW